MKKALKILGIVVAIPVAWVVATVGGVAFAGLLGLLPRPFDAVVIFAIVLGFIVYGFRQVAKGDPRFGALCIVSGLLLTVVAILAILGL